MKNKIKRNVTIIILQFLFVAGVDAQNTGIGTNLPKGKLHIKGTADTSQLVVDANSTQSNTSPLIRLRNAAGADLLHIHSDNFTNIFIGLTAGKLNNAAGGALGNTFVGAQAGSSNTTGFSLTGIGTYALLNNITGGENTAIGPSTLYSNTSGSYNTAIGRGALFQSNANNNTAIGFKSLFSNTSGSENTAIGTLSLLSTTIGNRNTAIGTAALYSNTSGSFNTANGFNTLYSNTTGNSNSANGHLALYSNTIGDNNTANGLKALYSNTSGFDNTANGSDALYSNTSGFDNTANGYYALTTNTTGRNNTANGSQTLYSNTTGDNNTANGAFALQLNTTGVYNTANGSRALFHNITGNNNTAVGNDALYYNTTGSNNVAIGIEAGPAPNFTNLFNTIGIGNDGAYQHGASNQVIIGNTSTLFIGGKVNWGIVSDERIKRNIKEDVKGLDFIMKLRPVTYNISNDAISEVRKIKDTLNLPGKYDGEKITYTGFLAQEVEKAAIATGYNFSGYTKPATTDQLYTIRYAEFVVPLTKAVQEQQTIITNQQKQIELLEKRLAVLEAKK
jgi:trimeric autotransporter adhesin